MRGAGDVGRLDGCGRCGESHGAGAVCRLIAYSLSLPTTGTMAGGDADAAVRAYREHAAKEPGE